MHLHVLKTVSKKIYLDYIRIFSINDNDNKSIRLYEHKHSP